MGFWGSVPILGVCEEPEGFGVKSWRLGSLKTRGFWGQCWVLGFRKNWGIFGEENEVLGSLKTMGFWGSVPKELGGGDLG